MAQNESLGDRKAYGKYLIFLSESYFMLQIYQNRTLRKMENIMVSLAKYVSSTPEATYQVAFEGFEKKILVGHQEIYSNKESLL